MSAAPTESAQSSGAQAAGLESGVSEPGAPVGWDVSPQIISWSGVALPPAAARKRRIALGKIGQLSFKSGVEARKCRLEIAPPGKGAQPSSLIVEMAADGQKAARLMLPLSLPSILGSLPQGAVATFSLSFRLHGKERAAPIDWIMLLGRGADGNLFFWRKIAERVDLRSPEIRTWRVSVVVNHKEMPSEILLGIELRPSSGQVTIGEIGMALEAVATDVATLDFDPKSGGVGRLRATEEKADPWLHACAGAVSLARFKVSRTTDLLKLKREGEFLRFTLSPEALALPVGAPRDGLRLVLTDRGTAVAQANVGAGPLPAPAERESRPLPAPAEREAGPLPAPVEREAGPPEIGAMDDQALATMLRQIRNGEVLSRARAHFKAKNWEGVLKFHKVLVGETRDYQRLLAIVGRAAVYANETQIATRLLGTGVAAFPDDAKMQYYYGLAHTGAGRYRESLPCFRAALRLSPSDDQTKKALASALRRAARDTTVTGERTEMLGEAAGLLSEVLAQEYSRATAITLGELLTELARHEEALGLIERLLADGQQDADVLLLKVRNLTALARVDEALPLADQVISIEPDNQSARFHRRALQFLGHGAAATGEPVLGDVIRLPSGGLLMGALGEAGWPLMPRPADAAELAKALARLPFDWLRMMDTRSIQTPPENLGASIDAFSGFCEHGTAGGQPTKLWRRDAIVHLAESGLIRPDLADLDAFEAVYGRSPASVSENSTVIIVAGPASAQGDGDDRFARSLAEHYRSFGYDAIVVGTLPDLIGKLGEADGFRFAFVEQTAASLRRIILQSKPRLVHALSGVGSEVSEALAYTNIPFIYGVHLEGEALGDDGEGYLNGDGRRISAPLFQRILTRAQSVYANSESTQSALERTFGIRCPVIETVPAEGGRPWGLA